MSWNLERVKQEIHVFAQHAREVIGNIDGVKQLELCPVEISKRMTRTKGSFEYEYRRRLGKVVGVKPLKIKIAQHLLDNYHDEDIIDVIRHECVHHIVDIYTKGKSRGHDEIFKRYCRKLGVSDETYFNAEPKTGGKDTPVKRQETRYIGKCQKCGHEYYRKQLRQSTLENWIHYCHCHKCKGQLHIIDTKEQVEYMKGSNTSIKKVSLNGTKKVRPPKPQPKVRTKAQLISSLQKMKAYELIDSCGYTDNFDSIWFDMLMVYNDGGWKGLTQRQMDALYKWLHEGKKYCEDSYNRGICVGRIYV